MFPRYKYHLELIQKIIDREIKEDANITIDIKDVNKISRTTIQVHVYGSTIEEIRELLDPLEIRESPRYGISFAMVVNFILIFGKGFTIPF